MSKNYIKNSQEIQKMKIAGKVLADTIVILKSSIRPGMDLLTLDKIAKNNILKNHCVPSFINYKGYKHTICASVNDILIHGIPSNYKIKTGDMVSIDIGCSFEGYHCDTAFSQVCGTPTPKQIKILDATYDALENAISHLKPGVSLKYICQIIENTIIDNGFYSPREYTGHGIGKQLHEDPIVPNNAYDAPNILLKEGMVIAIEPMLIENSPETFVGSDGWSVHTKNKNLSCHAEHTVLITKKGGTILTI